MNLLKVVLKGGKKDLKFVEDVVVFAALLKAPA